MKQLLTVLCLVLLVSCSDEPPPEVLHEVPSHRLIDSGGVLYEIGSNNPFTGFSVKYFNGRVNTNTKYKDGIKIGITIYNHNKNGQLLNMSTWTYTEPYEYISGSDGYLLKDDKVIEGPSEKYHENGQVEIRGNYVDVGNRNGEGQEKDGIWKYFDEDGNLTKTEEYKDGELIE